MLVTILFINVVMLWIIVLYQLLMIFTLARRQKTIRPDSFQRDPISLKIGEKAPDFSAQTLEGRTVALADYLGRPITVVFLKSQCKSCRQILPLLNTLESVARQVGVTLLIIIGDELEKARHLLEGNMPGLPVLVAPPSNNTLFKKYEISITPSYCSIDIHGKIHATGFATPDWIIGNLAQGKSF